MTTPVTRADRERALVAMCGSLDNSLLFERRWLEGTDATVETNDHRAVLGQLDRVAAAIAEARGGASVASAGDGREVWILEDEHGHVHGEFYDEQADAEKDALEVKAIAVRYVPAANPVESLPKFREGEMVDVYDRANGHVVNTCEVMTSKFRDGHYVYALKGKPAFYSEDFLRLAKPVESLAAWTKGSGSDLPEQAWAYVAHPEYGVNLAQHSYYEDSEPGVAAERVWNWVLYDVGTAVPRDEVTHYLLLGPLPQPPETP